MAARKSQKEHYVDNEKFLGAVSKYNKKCKGITSKGFSCNNNAQKDSDYCFAHQ